MAKITQIATAVYVSGETEMRRTVAVDELGHAWEFVGTRWIPLPKLPECSCHMGGARDSACKYHLTLAGGR